ncbi:hypothetical protein GCM10023347_47190 [Streptomyces chumphonensis]|uniref:DUF461 domain-containing protein n=1 Tax=Streptomyces chumphonensis TaxID=1214925 RepID=A0A927F1D1_9ACTN|nr:DUF461 domain-containing protein [Streptomyces chumphonensis]MBD3932892.1 DUF461 domain-containing protein [Streptomyces chumphonensis]
MSSSRSSLRRGAVAAAVLALSSLSLAGCGAGFDAGTNQIRPDNVLKRVGDIQLQNVTVITSEDADGPASITARIFNGGDEDETLGGISFRSDGGTGTFVLSPADGGSLTVPAGGHLMLGGEGNASAIVQNAGDQDITDGEAQQLTFELSATGDIDVRALVFPAEDITYEEWGPSASPSGDGPEQDAAEGGESPEAEESPGTGESPEGELPAEGEAQDDGAGLDDGVGGDDTDDDGDDDADDAAGVDVPADGVESAR